jgi:hypothetical protein
LKKWDIGPAAPLGDSVAALPLGDSVAAAPLGVSVIR